MKKEDHLEISEGLTKIAASATCPLKEKEVATNQLFGSTKIVICICEGQGNDFTCPHFYGAVYPNEEGGLFIDCRI